MTYVSNTASIASHALNALMDRQDIKAAARDAARGDLSAAEFVDVMKKFSAQQSSVLRDALDSDAKTVAVASTFGPSEDAESYEVRVSQLEHLLTMNGVLCGEAAGTIMSFADRISWDALCEATADAYEIDFTRDGWDGWAYLLGSLWSVAERQRLVLLPV